MTMNKVCVKLKTSYGIPQTCALVLTTCLLLACAQTSPHHVTGEEPIPSGIENQIHPGSTTQDEILALLGEPVARLKTNTQDGHLHIWKYSYLYLQGPQKGSGESLTITFDNKRFKVISVNRGPL